MKSCSFCAIVLILRSIVTSHLCSWLIYGIVYNICLWHGESLIYCTVNICCLLHGEYLLFIVRWISAVYCTVNICCLLHGEYLLFIAWWISEAPCVISWLSYDSRDVISTWWRQIWRRCGPYGSVSNYCDVVSVWWRQIWHRWYDFILRLYCIVGPNLYDSSYADMAWICRPICDFCYL